MFYILVLGLLFAVELLYFRFADRFNIIDKPNERSSHTRITLRGGGIIFWFAVLIYFISSGFSYPYFFVGLTLIGLISFMDDIKPVSSKLRLVFHFTAMLLMFFQWSLFSVSPWYIWLLALVLCIGFINACNFMDGINGITGGYGLIAALSLLYIDNRIVDFVDDRFIIIFIASLLVFNFFNFRKRAKCFAGDVGSISIAFILIFLIGKLIIETNDFSYVILMAVYGVDAILTIFHRIKLKEPLMEAHRKHLYQIMANELKIPHLFVSATYMVVQTGINIGFLYSPNHWLYLIVAVAVLCLVYIWFMQKYFHLHQSIKQ